MQFVHELRDLFNLLHTPALSGEPDVSGREAGEIAQEEHRSVEEIERILQAAEDRIREKVYGKDQTPWVRSREIYLAYLVKSQFDLMRAIYFREDRRIPTVGELDRKSVV